MKGFGEHQDEPLGSINMEFLDHFSNYQLKEDPVLCSQYKIHTL